MASFIFKISGSIGSQRLFLTSSPCLCVRVYRVVPSFTGFWSRISPNREQNETADLLAPSPSWFLFRAIWIVHAAFCLPTINQQHESFLLSFVWSSIFLLFETSIMICMCRFFNPKVNNYEKPQQIDANIMNCLAPTPPPPLLEYTITDKNEKKVLFTSPLPVERSHEINHIQPWSSSLRDWPFHKFQRISRTNLSWKKRLGLRSSMNLVSTWLQVDDLSWYCSRQVVSNPALGNDETNLQLNIQLTLSTISFLQHPYVFHMFF